MVLPNRFQICFKTISALVAGIFLFQQIAWAADLIDYALQKLNNEQSQTFAPQYLQSQQSIQENLIAAKQDTENFIPPEPVTQPSGQPQEEMLPLKGPMGGGQIASAQGSIQAVAAEQPQPSAEPPADDNGAVLSVTTQDGDIIHYRNGRIDFVEKKGEDGRFTVIRLLSNLSPTGELVDAEISYPDGTIQAVSGGKVVTITRPDKTVYNYNSAELIESVVYPDGTIVVYSYVRDGQGNVIEVILTGPETTCHYGSDNRLTKVEFSSGKVIEYDNGVISRITMPDKSLYIFDVKENADGTVNSTLAQYIAADGATYSYIYNENGSLASIEVKRENATASYNKEGVLLKIVKDGKVVDDAAIAAMRLDYEAAFAIYKEKEGVRIDKQGLLDSAILDLNDKTAARDDANANLNAAIQDLANAQSVKDAKEAAYNIAYNDYVSAQSAYNLADTALANARAVESQANQELTTAQNTLAAKQAAYNSAVQDRQTKETAFNTARTNLTTAQGARTLAENALSGGSPYVLSSYIYSASSTVLNQHKSFINDQFDSYNSNIWYKPTDSLVTIGSGSATLKGTGSNYNAAFYSNQSYNRIDKPVFSTTFKVSSASGQFIAALDGYNASNIYRRVGIFVQSGRIYVQTVNGASASNSLILVQAAKVNTNYNLQFDVTSQDIKIYLWEASVQRPTNPSCTYTITDWTAVRPYFSLYQGTATIDCVTLKSPNFNSTYNSISNLTKDVYQDGSASTYSYSTSSITISDYKQYLASPYSLWTQGLWYKPADTLVTIKGGTAALKGTGIDYGATFYSNQTFARSNDVVVRSTFQASSVSGKFIAALDGYTASNFYRRIGIVVQDGKIYVQSAVDASTNTPVVLIAAAKPNTNYTVEFQATAQKILVYLWETSTQRPANPSYTYTLTGWATVRPYFSLYSGTATVSNMYINYIPQVRTVSQGSSEYSQVLARNQLVKNLKNSVVNVNTAQSAYNSANTALTNAMTMESQAGQDLATAQNTFVVKQALYNNAVQDRQAKETALGAASANLAAKTAAKNQAYTALQTAVQNLTTAQAQKDQKQTEYDRACSSYTISKSAYDTALSDFTIAKGKEGDAKLSADSFLSELNTLKAVLSMFPANGLVISVSTNSEDVDILSVSYDKDRRITRVVKLDGSLVEYTDGLPVSTNGADGSDSRYSYLTSPFGTMLSATMDRNGLMMIYDLKGYIKKIVTSDNTEIKYAANEIASIITPDGMKRLYKAGKLDEIINIDGAKSTIANGKIARTIDPAGTVYEYSYSTDPVDSKELVTATDTTHGISRYYKDNLLLRTEDLTNLVSENTYYANGKLKEVVIKKNGKLISQYDYTYVPVNTDIETEVRDKDGNVRRYDKNDKLFSLLDTNNNTYRYEYPDAFTTRVSLYSSLKPNGDRIMYNNGAIDFITTSTGVRYEKLKFNETGLYDFDIVYEGNKRKSVRMAGDYKRIKTAQGTYLIFKNNELVAAATSQGMVMLSDTIAAGNIPGALMEDIVSNGAYVHQAAINRWFWRYQAGYNTYGVTDVHYDGGNQATLDLNIIGGDLDYSQGESFIEMRFDEAYKYTGTKDLTGKDVIFYVKAPQGLLSGHNDPLMVQAYAKDGSWQSLYAPTTGITREGVWYKIRLRVNNGPILGGETISSFRTDDVAIMGIRVKSSPTSDERFAGQLIVKVGPDNPTDGAPIVSEEAIVADLGNFRETIEDINGAARLISNKDYISQDDVHYIFEGTSPGAVPPVDMRTAHWDKMNYYYTQGVSSVERDDAGDQWIVHADLDNSSAVKSVGEIVVDLKYDIPSLNWNGPVDMRGKTLSFLVKAPPAFVPDPDNPNWAQILFKDANFKDLHTGYARITRADEWFRVTVTLPAFDSGTNGFDNTAIRMIGLKFSAEYAAPIKYNGPIYLKADIASDVFANTGPHVLVDLRGIQSYKAANRNAMNFKTFFASNIDYAAASAPAYAKIADDVIVNQEFSHNNLRTVRKGDNTITGYTDTGKIDYVSDLDGRIMVDYDYDEDSNLTAITMNAARRNLAESIEEANNKAAGEKVKALAELAGQRGVVVDQINQQIAPDLNILISQRESLRGQYNNLNGQDCGWDPFGTARREKSRALDSIARAIGQVNAAISQVQSQLSQAYAEVDVEVARLKAQIDSQTDTAFAQVKAEEDRLFLDILKQEAMPVILHYYRNALGRDPDTAEANLYLSKISFDRQKLDKNEIMRSILASSEYNTRKDQVGRIKSGVRTLLQNYLALTLSDDKNAFLDKLGLAQSELAAFNKYDIDKILKWLDSQELHFGHSAFLALNNILATNGITSDFEELAASVIVIDILSGAIDIFTTGDLELSMFGLSKYAFSKGLNLNNTKLAWDDLRTNLTSSGRVIAHIDSNHYIVITNIENDKVYYREENKGTSGTDEVMTKDDFLKKWSGYTITKTSPTDQAKIISTEEAKKVKGSFFVFLIPLIGAIIGAIGGVISGIIAAIGGIIAGVMAAVGTALANIAGFIAGIGSQLFSGIGAVFGGLGSMLGGFVGGSFIGAAVKTLVGVGLSLGVSTGLQALGVNSTIANLTSSFLTGGILGLLSPIQGVSMFNMFMSEGLKYATIQGISEIGTRLKLDPNITSIIGITAGALVGGMWQGKLGETLVKIAPAISSEFAYYGITKFGNLLGVPESISYLAGIGISSSLQAGLTDGFKPDVMWRGIVDGLTDPKTLSIAFSVAGDAIGLDPLYNNIIINLAAGAIEGGLENPQNIIYGMFKGMLDNFIQTSVRALSFGLYDPVEGGWNQNYQRQYWFTHLINFVTAMQEEGGIVQALTRYMSTIFRDDAIRSINEAGGIADFLTGNAEIVYENGIAKKKVNFTDGYKLYLDPNTDEVIGRDVGEIQERGHYGINPWTGGFGLIDGTILESNENGTMVYHVRDSLIIDKIDFFGTGRNYSIVAMDPEIGLQLDENGLPIGGIVEDFEGIQLFEYEYIDDSMNMKLNIQNPSISGGNVSINLSNISEAEKQEIINYYMLANGINNMNPYGSPGYMDGFAIDLAHADPGAEDFTFIPLFNEFYGKISPATFEKIYQNQIYAIAIYEDLKSHGYVDQEGKILPSFLEVKNPSDFIMSSQFSAIKNDIYQILWSSCQHATEDVVKWLQDVHGDSHEITNKIISDIQTKFAGNYPVDMVGFGYSGAGDPFIQAINQQVFDGQYLDVEALVLVATPLKKYYWMGLWENREIVNPNVKTVVTIEGEKDGLFHPTDHNFGGSLFVQNEFKIIIKDASHVDYFYDPNRPSANDAFKMKVSRFIAEVTARSKDPDQLILFLESIVPPDADGKYIIDVNEVTYD